MATRSRFCLPIPTTSFVNREHELTELSEALTRNRIVTLIGAAGVGKTRLALQHAERIATSTSGSTWFVELSNCRGGADAEASLRSALGAIESPDDPTGSLAERLEDCAGLVLLDGCEAQLEAAGRLALRIVAEGKSMTVLATGRQPLGLLEERVVPVPPLSVPPAEVAPVAGAQEGFAAVRLFHARAALADRRYRPENAEPEQVASICRGLDGLPLAIELAAARVREEALDEIAEHLHADREAETPGDDGVRPRTLETAIGASYDGLLPEEKAFLRSLSVFAGSWALESAAEVAAVDLVEALDLASRLMHKSLIAPSEDGEGDPRRRLLEPIRHFAAERLREAGEEPGAHERHARHFLVLAERAEPHLLGPDQAEWTRRLARERANLLAVLERAGESAAGPARALRLVAAVWRSWYAEGSVASGLGEIERALGGAPADVEPEARVQALLGAGLLSLQCGDPRRARERYEECLERCRERDDRAGAAAALNGLGAVAGQDGPDLEAARDHFERSLALYREIGDQRGIARALLNLGEVGLRMGRTDVARTLYEQSLAARVQLGDRQGVALTHAALASVAVAEDRTGDAVSQLLESFRIVREIGHRVRAVSALRVLAALAAAREAHADAVHFYAVAEAIERRSGSRPWVRERADEERVLQHARDRLGEAGYRSAWESGSAARYEEVLEAVLAWLDDVTRQ